MPKVGLILSGCGVFDGSEIHEAVISILALDRAGAEIVYMAPDIDQMHVIDHQTGEPMEGETRNVLVESARIARGPVKNIAEVKSDDLDAIVMPGGFGAAKNLCNFAVKGPECEINSDVEKLIQEMHAAGKPVVAECIAPAAAMKAFTDKGIKPTVTIGTDPDTAGALEAMGGKHANKNVEEYCVDEENKLITTPAYMLGPSIRNVAEGIENTINALMKMLG